MTTSDNPGECICHALVSASMTQGVLKAMVKQTPDAPVSCKSRENSRPRLAPLARKTRYESLSRMDFALPTNSVRLIKSAVLFRILDLIANSFRYTGVGS
ncbi:MAG: hypothetical protein ABJB10_11645 [Mesorhizobium sp.]